MGHSSGYVTKLVGVRAFLHQQFCVPSTEAVYYGHRNELMIISALPPSVQTKLFFYLLGQGCSVI